MMLYYSRSYQQFPPIISKCPDFFIINNEGKCENVANVGGATTTWNEAPMESTTEQGLCDLRNRLNMSNLTWDGITNNPDICSFN